MYIAKFCMALLDIKEKRLIVNEFAKRHYLR